LLQYGPFISEREKDTLVPTIKELMNEVPSEIQEKGFIFQNENLRLKAFNENLSRKYEIEQECILELQSTESVPILVAYDDSELVIVMDLVYGQDLPTHCKEQGVSVFTYEEELISSLQSMVNKGWYLPCLSLDYIIWCEDCDALFVIDFSGCERVYGKDLAEYNGSIKADVKKLFKEVVF
jgi:hypothetical protein